MPKELKTPLELVRLIRKHRRAHRLTKCLIVVEPDELSGWTAKSMATPELVATCQLELDTAECAKTTISSKLTRRHT